MNVYPNPAKENVNVSFNATQGLQYTINVIDITGRSLMVISDVAVDGINEKMIDVKSLSSGIYNMVIKSANGTEKVRLMVD